MLMDVDKEIKEIEEREEIEEIEEIGSRSSSWRHEEKGREGKGLEIFLC